MSCSELVRDLRDAFAGRSVSQPAPTLVAPAAGVPVVAASRTHHRAPRRRYLGLAAAGLIVAGLASGALLNSFGDDGGRAAGRSTQRTTTEPTSTEQTTTTQTETEPQLSVADAERMTDEGLRLMEAGDYGSALPILEQAVQRLTGTGVTYEAYALYNLAYTRLALGRCDGVLEFLDRSENIQGERREINQLYSEAYNRCVGGGGDGDD